MDLARDADLVGGLLASEARCMEGMGLGMGPLDVDDVEEGIEGIEGIGMGCGKGLEGIGAPLDGVGLGGDIGTLLEDSELLESMLDRWGKLGCGEGAGRLCVGRGGGQLGWDGGAPYDCEAPIDDLRITPSLEEVADRGEASILALPFALLPSFWEPVVGLGW
jgi:hypothetical protein